MNVKKRFQKIRVSSRGGASHHAPPFLNTPLGTGIYSFVRLLSPIRRSRRRTISVAPVQCASRCSVADDTEVVLLTTAWNTVVCDFCTYTDRWTSSKCRLQPNHAHRRRYSNFHIPSVIVPRSAPPPPCGLVQCFYLTQTSTHCSVRGFHKSLKRVITDSAQLL